jgi:hypothetical protein
MGHFTLQVDGKDFALQTVPGSARIKVIAPEGIEFFFDPDWERYVQSGGTADFDPKSVGIDRDSLTESLLDVDSKRSLEYQRLNAEQVIRGAKATLFDNGDFAYFVYLDQIRSLAGGLALTITSQWKSASKPEEEQIRFRACLDRQGLEQLQSLIQKELAK